MKVLMIGTLAIFILIGMFAAYSIFTITPTNQRIFCINGTGDYIEEKKCPDPNTSAWTITISGKLTEKSEKEFPSMMVIAITHFIDGDWHVYKHKLERSEGDYVSVTIKDVKLNPLENYKIVIDTVPNNLKWTIEIKEEWIVKE